MSPTLDACLRSWPLDPWLLAALLLTAGVYLRGWLVLHHRQPSHPRLSPRGREARVRGRWHGGQLAAFYGGLATIYLALASPIEPFAGLLLWVHMLQHILLMMVGPPLLWLGTPLLPLLWGLPRPVRLVWAGPLLSAPPCRRLFRQMTHPLTALPLFLAAAWFWHVPAVYDLALRSSGWHYLQHVCFLGTALLFWYPVVLPHPARPRWSPWLLLPVLLLADLSNTALSALLTFSERVLYPYYAEVPRLGGLSAVEDQSAAGVLMWIPGSVAFLLPLFGIAIRLLSGQEPDKETGRQGDKETRRQGDKETRRQGDRETGRQGEKTETLKCADSAATPWVNASFCLLVSLSPCLPVSLSPCLPVSLSPCLPVSLSPCLPVWFRPVARAAAGAVSTMAACPPCATAAPGGAGRRSDPGRLAGTPGRTAEPRWSLTLDSLAGSVDPEPAGGGQPLLHGLSVPAAADPGPPLAPDGA